MKILFLISTLANGGAERAMSNITMHLPDGVEADLLVNSISDHDFPTRARIISLGMKPERKMGFLYQAEANARRIVKTRKLKKRNHYDACISFMDSANMCNILTKTGMCRTIISVRTSVAHDKSFMSQYIARPMIRLLYNRADCVVAVAEGIRDELENCFKVNPDRVKVITNGFDIDEIHRKMDTDISVELESGLHGKFVYASAGRYCAAKGYWHLIRAFSEVAGKCGDAVLLLIGKGEDEPYLTELIRNYQLQDRVIMVPFLVNPFGILARCSVFVMPSMFEGYCNALCEALICGLPCIATDFRSSAREILAPDTPYAHHIKDGIEYAEYGVLTPVCSGKRYRGTEPLEAGEQYLAKAMVSLYRDGNMLMKYQERARVRGQQLDIGQKVQEWLRLVL